MFAGRTCTIQWYRVLWCVGLTALIAALPTTPGFAESSVGAGGAGSEKKSGQEKGGKAGDDDKIDKAKDGDGKANKKKPSKGTSKKDDKKGAIVIDPDLQKKLDELAKTQGRARGEKGSKTRSSQRREQPPKRESKPSSRPTNRRTPRGTRAGGDPAGTPGSDPVDINIPAVEDTDSDLPPEEREYEFSLIDATYEQLIAGIARQTGLGVIGQAPKNGTVSFVTTEKLNFDQLMDRVRTLLFNFNLLDPYHILRRETHLEVLRVNDILRKLPPKCMFQNVNAFLASGLSDSELALVIYTPTTGSVADLNEIRNFLPDYVRVAPLEGQNRVTIFALVSDIYKYLDLITFFHSDSDDPRPIEEIEVVNVLPSIAIVKLEKLMDLGGGSPTRSKSSRKSGSRGSTPNPLLVINKFEVTLVPEDVRGVIIVRAMQDKIDEIKRLLPYVDVDTGKDLPPVVIELEHAEPNKIIAIVRQILTASEGPLFGAVPRSASRKKKGSSVPAALNTADVTMFPHPAGSAIIVMGEDKQIERVRELVRRFDMEIEIGPLRITLEHAEASNVSATIAQVLAAGTGGGKSRGKTPQVGFQLVPDPSGSALWFTGSEKNLDTVRELVAALDVADEAVSLHVVTLEHREPSFVADMLRQFDGGAVKPKRKSKAKDRAARKAIPVAAKFTPDDNGRLLVMCTDQEWADYLPLIEELDATFAEDEDPFVQITLTYIEPEKAIERFTTLLGSDIRDVRYVEAGGDLLVIGATDLQLEDMRTLLTEIDVASELEQRTFDILYADPSEIVTLIETFVGDGGSRASRGKRPAPKSSRKGKGGAQATISTEAMSIVQLDRQLVVRATGAKMEQIAAIIDEFDVPEENEPPFSRLEITHISTSQAIERLEVVLMSAGSKGSTITLVPAEGAVLILGATPSEIEDAEAVLAEFDRPSRLLERIFVIQHVDAQEIASLLETLVGEAPKGRKPTSKSSGKKGKGRLVRTTGGTADSDLQIVQLGDRLVITATQVKMQRVVELIEEFDVAEEAAELRVYEDFPSGTDIEAIAETLSTNLDGAPMPGRKRGGKGSAGKETGPRFIPQSAAGKLVVIAKPSQLEKIEELLEVLRWSIEVAQPEIRFISVEHADPEEVVEQIEPLLSIKVQTLIREGSLTTAPLDGEVAGKAIKGGRGSRRATTKQRFHLEPDTRNKRIVVAAAPVIIEEATLLIRQFDKPSETSELKVYDQFHRGVNIDAIADTLSSTFGGTPASGRKSKRGAVPKKDSGLQFIPQPAARRLLVIAKPSEFEKIEELIDVLSVGTDLDQPEVVFIDLEYADAEEVVEKIEPLLSIKVGRLIEEGKLTSAPLEGEGGGKGSGGGKRRRTATTGQQRFHLEPDTRNGRIVVAAPPVVIEEAISLIMQFDRPDETAERVFRTVALHNSDADEMVAAVKEMMDGKAPRRRGLAGGGKGKRVSAPASDDGFVVTTAPGGGAVLLHGTLEDVERSTGWIEQLDNEAVAGREIKVYEIANADIETLVDVIMNVVDTPAPAGKGKKAPRRRRVEAPMEDDFEFQTTLTRVGAEVYIQADLISNTMLVAASKNKLARIDELVLQFDDPEGRLAGLGEAGENLPMRVFDLKYADAFDAVWDLEVVLGALWQPADRLPTVEEFFVENSNALIVRCLDEDRFAEIEELITKYVDVRPEPTPPVFKKFPVPPGMTPEQAAQWLKLHHPEFDIKLLNVTPAEEDEGVDVEQVKPQKTARANRYVLPTAFTRAVADLTAAVVAVGEDMDSSSEQPEEKEERKGKKEKSVPAGVDALLSETASKFMDGSLGTPTERAAADEDPEIVLEQIEIFYDEEENVLIFKGHEDIVQDMEDALEELIEEIERIGGPPDIRVYRVRYIDVYAAQDIIEEMYNTPRKQLAQIQQAQRQAQQQAARRAQQLAQMQRAQQGGKGKQGADGKGGATPGGKGAPTPPTNIPQIPPTTVRVYPNPRDRTLILRAETSQYPAILELLATIDQPRPFESRVRIFHLEKNNATEVEQLLKTFLGIEDSRGRRRSTSRTGSSSRQQSTPQQGGQPSQLMMQDTGTPSGPLGVDPADIKITANADTNTIIAMAPPVALDKIEELIDDLESLELPERITKHYTLGHADVQEMTNYLAAHFDEGSSSSASSARAGRRGGRQQPSPRSGPQAFNAPTFIAFPRLSMLTAQATQEQIEKIDELIEVLDVSSDTDEWVTVTLAHADAGTAASTLTTMFGGSGAQQQRSRRGGRGGSRAATTSTSGPTFIGADGDKLLFFSASKSLHEQIHEVIGQLEEQSKVSTDVRVIQLEHAEPSTVAQAIESAYGGSRRSSSRRGGGRRGGSSSTMGFTITSDDPSKRLFVVADDDLFTKIESLAESLDQKREMPFDFKIYPLQYANARKVHEMLNALIVGWMRSSGGGRRGGGGGMSEAFAVEVDDKANALIVLGSETVFAFVDEALSTVDIPANAVSPPGFLIVSLKNANAVEVAQNINRLWGQRGGPRGRGGAGGGETPPQVEANRTLNMLIVRGTQEQCDQIKKEFIDPLEEQAPPKLLTETITLVHAQPEAVAESINRVFEDKRRAYQALGRGSTVSPLEFTVVVTPDVDTQQLIIQASTENMEYVRARVTELDQPEFGSLTATTMKIYQVKYADPNAVVNIINQWARARTQGGGGRRGRQVASRDMVTAVAEHATHSVVVTASASNHKIVQELIDGLDSEELATGQRKRQVISLQHANSDQVASQLTQLARQAPRVRGDRGPGFVSDPTTNSILALVSDVELEEITGLLEILDVEPGTDTERTMQVYKIKFADPNGIVNAINQTFRGARGRQVRAVDQVVAVVDWGTQSVIVTASGKNHEKVAELISTLDDESMATGHRTRHVIKLNHANSDEVANQLVQTFRQMRRRRGDAGPGFISDSKTNSIIATVNSEELAEITELLIALDTEPDIDTVRAMIVYHIKYADPNGIVNTINQTYRWNRRNQARPEDQVVAVSEWATQSVIVTASAKNHDKIQALIEEIDQEGVGSQAFETVQLQHANSDELARQLNDVYGRSRRSTRRGEQPVTISSIPRANALIVRGKQTDIDEVKALIVAFDVEESTDTQRSTEVYPLRYADPNSINVVVLNMFRWDRRTAVSPSEKVTSAVDWGTQSLVVTASEKNHKVISTLVEQVDKESTFKKQKQLIRLEHANAEDVSRTLGQVLRASQRRTRRGETPVAVSADAGTNSLVIVASELDLAELLPLIESFDVKPSEDQEPVMIPYPLRHADPRGLAGAITQAFRSRGGRRPRPEDQVTAVAESGTQTVIVTAVPKNQEKVKAFIDLIDIESDFVPQPHVYRLEHADADELARSLQQQYRGRRGQQVPQISAVQSTNSLLIRATARDMEELAELIKPLDVKPDPESGQQIKSFRLTFADPSSVENAINRLFRPSGRSRSARDQVSAVPEWGSKSVIVSASPDNMIRVEALIADLDSEGGGRGEVEVINIEHADPSGVARALNDIFVRSAPRSRGGAQPISISEIQGTKSILVKANEIDMERIKETVAELDTDVFQAGEAVRVVQLVRSDVSEMKTAVEAILAKPGKGRGRSGDLVGDIRVSMLTQANALVISGSQDEVDSLEAQILAMDAEAGEGIRAKLILLTHADPERILPIVQDLYTNQRGGSSRRGKMQPVITATQAPKGLFVRADPMDFSEIVDTIAQLDTEEAGDDEAFRIIGPVPQGRDINLWAANLEDGLNNSARARAGQSGSGRGRGSAPSITIKPDERSRTLFVTGSASMFDQVEDAVAELQATGPVGPTTITVLRPEYLNLEDIRRVLEQMKGEGSGSGSSRRSSGSSRSRRR